MLQSMGSQRVGHDWATEQQQQIILRLYFLKKRYLLESHNKVFTDEIIWCQDLP